MKRYRTGLLFVMMAVLFAASGASCPFFNPPKDDLARLPPALPPSPSLQDIIAVVNRNSAAIERFSSNQVSISVAGYPTLRGNVAYERPQRFRLVAGLAISFAGNEVDLGSNDEVFWFWIHRNTPPAVYYCRHDEFASSPIRNSLPFDPHLVIEAFGLVQLDPNGRYEGPFPVRGGYEIHTIRQTPEGPARKDIVIEGQQGLVVEQRIYDARQQLIATATTGRFHRDDYTGLIMPTLIQVRSPLQQFSMEITLAAVKINEPIGNPQQLWTMPIYQGSPPVNLCRPNREMFPGQPAAVSSPSGRSY